MVGLLGCNAILGQGKSVLANHAFELYKELTQLKKLNSLLFLMGKGFE